MQENQKIINGIPIAGQWQDYWRWLPSLYMTRGLPYVILMMTSMVFFNRMGMSNGAITLTTSWFFVPLIFRPLLGRFVIGYKSKRFWILLTEFIMALCLAGIAHTVTFSHWFTWSVTFLMIIAVSASLHDVAIERFYKKESKRRYRSAFFDSRAVFYLLSALAGLAIPITIAGNLEVINRTVRPSWAMVFWSLAALMFGLMVLQTVLLPKKEVDVRLPIWSGLTRKWWSDVKSSVVIQPGYVASLCFLFCFLIPEGMFFRVSPLFLIDPGSNGGIALSPQELGLVQGTVGTFAFIAGCSIGTMLIRRDGLKRWLWVFVMGITLPKALFIYLSYYFVSTLSIINICVIIEQFGCGMGLAAYVIWLVHCTKNEHPTFTYSLATAITSFSMLISGWFIGLLQENIGYRHFFLLVFLSGIVCFISAYFIPVTEETGRQRLQQYKPDDV